MRKDAKKNLKDVAKIAIKNPDIKPSEVVEQTGLSRASAYNKLDELRQGGVIEKSSDVIRIAKIDLEHLEQIQGIEGDHIAEYANKANKGEFFKPSDLESLNRIGERKQKRYSMLMGENTDKKGAEKVNPELKIAVDKLLGSM